MKISRESWHYRWVRLVVPKDDKVLDPATGRHDLLPDMTLCGYLLRFAYACVLFPVGVAIVAAIVVVMGAVLLLAWPFAWFYDRWAYAHYDGEKLHLPWSSRFPFLLRWGRRVAALKRKICPEIEFVGGARDYGRDDQANSAGSTPEAGQ